MKKIDAVFMAERSIEGCSSDRRHAHRKGEIAPLVHALLDGMGRERAKLSRHNELAKSMDYILTRVDAFTRFLHDGRICMSNNAAERALCGVALGRNQGSSPDRIAEGSGPRSCIRWCRLRN